MADMEFRKGLIELGRGVWAWLQPDGRWGLSNAGLVAGGGRSLLVDTLYDTRLTGEMLASMREATPDAGTIDILVNTHDNGDHWYGNQAAEAGEIVSSEACAGAMAAFPPTVMAEVMKGAGQMGELGNFLLSCFGKFDYEGIVPTLPTLTFEGRLELAVGDWDVELIEVGPCHTTGDVIVHVPHARTVFAADVLFIGGHQIMWAGPVGNFIKAIDRILDLDPEFIVPGHGPVTDRKGALEIKGYWEHYAAEARKRFDRGMPAFDAAQDIPPGPYADYHDPEKTVINVNALYKEFSNDPTPIVPLEQFGLMAKWSA